MKMFCVKMYVGMNGNLRWKVFWYESNIASKFTLIWKKKCVKCMLLLK
jgi:hypothetical protein